MYAGVKIDFIVSYNYKVATLIDIAAVASRE